MAARLDTWSTNRMRWDGSTIRRRAAISGVGRAGAVSLTDAGGVPLVLSCRPRRHRHPPTAPSIVAAVTAALVVGVAGGAWAWDSHQGDAATHRRRRRTAAAVVDAQASDVDVAVGHAAALDRARPPS